MGAMLAKRAKQDGKHVGPPISRCHAHDKQVRRYIVPGDLVETS